MRFNLEQGAGEYRHADVEFVERSAKISLWMGDPAHAPASLYKVEFDKTWPPELDIHSAHDAIRAAVAHALVNNFDPSLVVLMFTAETPRWSGRIIDLAGGQ